MDEKPIDVQGEAGVQSSIDQPEVESPTPVIEQKPRINKFVILGVILGILFVTGIAFGAYKLGQRQLQPTPSPTPEAVATPTPDPTADWETYINSEYRYSIKYPKGLTPVDKTELWFGGEGKSGVLFEGANISVLVTGDPWDVFKKSITADFNGEMLEVDIAGEKALVLEGKDLGEGGEFPVKKCLIRYNDKNYQLVVSGEPDFTDHLNTFNLMLSTFKFLGEETPQQVSIPNDWQEYTATDIDFGIKTTLSLPPGFSFRFTGSEFTIQNDSDATELWDYSTSVFRKGDIVENFYEGGSRRAWYQDYLEGKFLEEKPVLFEEGKIDGVVEHSIGSQTYLELTVSGGVNYVGEIEKHFIFVQNQILHVMRPASFKANSAEAQIPGNIGIIFYSLKSNRID